MNTNQRKTERQYIEHLAQVYRQPSNQFLGNMINLSRTGLMTLQETGIEVGQAYRLQICCPEAMDDCPTFEVDVVVKRNQVSEITNYFETGFEFSSVEPGTEEIIETIIRRYALDPALI